MVIDEDKSQFVDYPATIDMVDDGGRNWFVGPFSYAFSLVEKYSSDLL